MCSLDKAKITQAMATPLFQPLTDILPYRCFGKVQEVFTNLVKVTLPGAKQGELCLIDNRLAAEVITIKAQEAWLSPFDVTIGLVAGACVERLGHGHRVRVGEHLLGGIVDGLGRPLEKMPNAGEWRSNHNSAPDPLTRQLISEVLPTGIKAIDGILTLGVGQRIGIFAAAGGGKSTLLGMLARGCEADVVVLALVGERGREVREFLDNHLPASARKKTILVVATSDRPPLERMKASLTATTIAEYFRDQGKRVLLMVDSLTRFARAEREIGLAAGEPPVANGFPPSVFVHMAALLERAGSAKVGSISAIYTVLVEGDNMNEPVADEVRSILDGHIVLSRQLAAAGHFPAIDVNASVSRVMDNIVSKAHRLHARRLRELRALFQDVQLLIRVGEYQSGQDKDTDEAIKKNQPINQFLRQGYDELVSFDQTIEDLSQLV